MESGIAVVRNLKTDKVYLFYADNIKNECIRMRFMLDMGTFECKSLQEDYTATGLEVFRFDTVEITDKKERLEEISKEFPDQYR